MGINWEVFTINISIEMARGSYNSVSKAVLHCDLVCNSSVAWRMDLTIQWC